MSSKASHGQAVPTIDMQLLATLPPVELSSERITMRPYCAGDAGALFAAATESVATVGRWMPWCHAGYRPSDSAAWVEKCAAAWESGEEFSFALFDTSGRYVGGAGLNHFNRVHNLANLGYWIRQSRQGAGLAVEATSLLAHYGFTALKLTRIEIVAAADNTASRRVAEKAGAQFECLARNRLVIHDVPIVAAVYSLVPDRAV